MSASGLSIAMDVGSSIRINWANSPLVGAVIYHGAKFTHAEVQKNGRYFCTGDRGKLGVANWFASRLPRDRWIEA